MALQKITTIAGRAVTVPDNDVDTDRIIPARYLRCITFDGLGEFAFYDERKAAADAGRIHPLDDACHAGAEILVSGCNFGCGSSREHAPQSLRRAGFRAIIAGSFAEIFFGNATTIGLPCVAVAEKDLAEITAWVQTHPAEELVVDIARLAIVCGGKTYAADMPAASREALETGRWDAIADLLEEPACVAAVGEGLPYTRQ
jgi:3-isopropylmalate/(R)-2-methylmalate dehydratase small subunit